MIPQNAIDEILSRVVLSDLISPYTEFKGGGKQRMALCPFHQEKTPSFSVSDEKGLYHCFGCGASGNAITFLMEYRKMSFPEAIGELAEQVGVDISRYEGKENSSFVSRKPLYDLHRELAGFYHRSLMDLPSAQHARQYLQMRGLNKETVEHFQIGWGGTEWQFAINYLTSKGFSKEVLLNSGIAVQGTKGIFDRFKDRIIFPIFDREDRLVGFGGRILQNDERSAKYLNTPETAIFHKGQLLFGLKNAKNALKSRGFALIVEGYLDVIGLSQVGIENAVAPLGTSLTQAQLKLLKRFVSDIVFVFDGDEAGIKAANRALDMSSSEEIGQRVLIIPNKEDPFDVAIKHGKDYFLNLVLKKSLLPIDFKLKFFARQFHPQKDQLRFLKSVFGFIALNPSRVVQEEMLRKTSDYLKLKIEVLLEEFARFLSKNKNFGNVVRESSKVKHKIPDSEIRLLALLLVYPEEIQGIKDLISSDVFQSTKAAKIFEFVLENTDKTTKEFFSMIKDPLLINIASEYAVMAESVPVVRDLALKVKIEFLQRQLVKNRKMQVKVQNTDELDKNTRYIQRDQEIVEEIRSFEEERKKFAQHK